jgi:hypothetical protein
MTQLIDLSATNGRIVVVQYAEAHPPLIAKPGMGAKRVTYYRRHTLADTKVRMRGIGLQLEPRAVLDRWLLNPWILDPDPPGRWLEKKPLPAAVTDLNNP